MGTVQENSWGRDFKGKKADALKREKWRVKSEEFNSQGYLREKEKKADALKREKWRTKSEEFDSLF